LALYLFAAALNTGMNGAKVAGNLHLVCRVGYRIWGLKRDLNVLERKGWYLYHWFGFTLICWLVLAMG